MYELCEGQTFKEIVMLAYIFFVKFTSAEGVKYLSLCHDTTEKKYGSQGLKKEYTISEFFYICALILSYPFPLYKNKLNQFYYKSQGKHVMEENYYLLLKF